MSGRIEASQPKGGRLVPFDALCYGAKFKYAEGDTAEWVKVSHNTIAGWEARNVATKWVAQPLCLFADDDNLTADVWLLDGGAHAIDERAEFERIFGIGSAVVFLEGKYVPAGFTQYAKDAAEHANTLWPVWEARAALDGAGAAVNWIDCQERLPEHVKAEYLCLFEHGDQQVSEWIEDETEGWVFWYGNPTHWVPLPGKPVPKGA